MGCSRSRSPAGSDYRAQANQGQSVFKRLGKPVAPVDQEEGQEVNMVPPGEATVQVRKVVSKVPRRQLRRAHLARILKSGDVNPAEAWKLWRQAAGPAEFRKYRKNRPLLPPMPQEYQSAGEEVESELLSRPDVQESLKVTEQPPGLAKPSSPRSRYKLTAPIALLRAFSPRCPGPANFVRPIHEPLFLLRPIAPAPSSQTTCGLSEPPILKPVPNLSPWERLGPPATITRPPVLYVAQTPAPETNMEMEVPAAIGSRYVQADRPWDVPEIIVTSPSPPVPPEEESPVKSAETPAGTSSGAVSNLPVEGWQDVARALPSPEPWSAALPGPPAREGIPEPLFIERQIRARLENLENQRLSNRKKRKRRGPRHLQIEDSEGGVPRPTERPWDDDVLEIDEGYDDDDFFADEDQ